MLDVCAMRGRKIAEGLASIAGMRPIYVQGTDVKGVWNDMKDDVMEKYNGCTLFYK